MHVLDRGWIQKGVLDCAWLGNRVDAASESGVLDFGSFKIACI